MLIQLIRRSSLVENFDTNFEVKFGLIGYWTLVMEGTGASVTIFSS